MNVKEEEQAFQDAAVNGNQFEMQDHWQDFIQETGLHRPDDQEAPVSHRKLEAEDNQKFEINGDEDNIDIEESEDLEALSDEDAGDYSQEQTITSLLNEREEDPVPEQHDLGFDTTDDVQNYIENENLNQEGIINMMDTHDFERAFGLVELHEENAQEYEILVNYDGKEWENVHELPEYQVNKVQGNESYVQTSPKNFKALENIQKSAIQPTKTPKEKQFKQINQTKRPQTKELQQQQSKKLKDKLKNKEESTAGTTVSNTKNVDLLIVGGGPASLGFIINSIKNNKFGELIQNDGLAILEAGLSFGGGNLCSYGINSNTSANGFVKCILSKTNKDRKTKGTAQTQFQSNEKNKIGVIPKFQIAGKTVLNQKANPKQKHKTSNNQTVAQSPHLTRHPQLVQHQTIVKQDQTKLNSQLIDNETSVDPNDPKPISKVQDLKTFDSSNLKQANNQAFIDKKQEFKSQIGSGALIKKKTQMSEVSKSDLSKPQILSKQVKSPVIPEPVKALSLVKTQNQLHQVNQTSSVSIPGYQTMNPKKMSQAQAVFEEIEKQDSENEIGTGLGTQGILPLTCFKDLVNSSIVATFKSFGRQIVPLSLVGHLLNYVGNYVLYNAYQINRSKIFYPMHKALSVQLMGNGDIITKVQKTEFKIVISQDQNNQSVSVLEGKQQLIYFRSKAIVIAGGASMGLHPQIFQWFPCLLASEESMQRLVISDEFLKKWVYWEQIKKLKRLQDEAGYIEREDQQRIFRRPKKKLSIVIIGGSHSGFSCAWMLLNGPSMFQNNQAGVITQNGKVPFATRKAFKNCQQCCTCNSEEVQFTSVPEQVLPQSRDASSGRIHKPQKLKNNAADISEPMSPTNRAQLKDKICSCICKCFGFFKYDDWGIEETNIQLPIFEEGNIKILYRDNIKVFFKTSLDAIKANYHDFEKEKYKQKDGYVYSFTGLRGDAKNLYLRVKNGLEKRVQFIKAKTPQKQNYYVEQADLIIWACGYQSKSIPIFENNKQVVLSQTVPNTQFDVDSKCRILLADGSVLTKCFACGVGFPVRTKDGLAGTKGEATNPRADSFSLYMNTVGEILLKNLTPKKRMTMMMLQREITITQYQDQTVIKGQQTTKKKKSKDLLSIFGQNVLSQPYLLAQSKYEDLKGKQHLTQKHFPMKVAQLQQEKQPQIQTTTFIQEGFIKSLNRMQQKALPLNGIPCESLIEVHQLIRDQSAEKSEYSEWQNHPDNNSRSLDRKHNKMEANELINEFLKKKHNRGFSHSRLVDQLTYSDLIKRNRGQGRREIQAKQKKLSNPGFPMEEGEYAQAVQTYINNLQAVQQTNAATILLNDRKTPKNNEYDSKLQLPDISRRESQTKFSQVGLHYKNTKDVKKKDPTREKHGQKSLERVNSKKRQQAMSGKSPLLLQKKQQAIQRENPENQKVFTNAHMSVDKTQSVALNQQQQIQTKSLYIRSAIEVAARIDALQNSMFFSEKQTEQKEISEGLLQQLKKSKRAELEAPQNFNSRQEGNANQPSMNSQKNKQVQNRKPLEQKQIGNKKVNKDLRGLIDDYKAKYLREEVSFEHKPKKEKKVVLANNVAKTDQQNTNKTQTSARKKEEKLVTEFPPINLKPSLIPSIRRSIPNRKQLNSSQSNQHPASSDYQKSIEQIYLPNQTASARSFKSQTFKYNQNKESNQEDKAKIEILNETNNGPVSGKPEQSQGSLRYLSIHQQKHNCDAKAILDGHDQAEYQQVVAETYEREMARINSALSGIRDVNRSNNSSQSNNRRENCSPLLTPISILQSQNFNKITPISMSQSQNFSQIKDLDKFIGKDGRKSKNVYMNQEFLPEQKEKNGFKETRENFDVKHSSGTGRYLGYNLKNEFGSGQYFRNEDQQEEGLEQYQENFKERRDSDFGGQQIEQSNLNRIYAPYDLQPRQEVAKILAKAHKSPKARPKSKKLESSLEYHHSKEKNHVKSDFKRKSMKEAHAENRRNENLQGQKSASVQIKTSVPFTFTASKQKDPITTKSEVVQPEPKKISLTNQIIARLAVSSSGLVPEPSPKPDTTKCKCQR